MKRLLCLGVMLFMSIALFAGCGYSKPTEEAQSGAYFATGNSGEYAVISGNLITVSKSIPGNITGAASTISDVFMFSLDGNSYVGENTRKSISFKLLGDKLTAKIAWHGKKTKEITFIKNNSIEFSDEAPIQPDTPKDIKTDSIGMLWSFEELIGKGETVSNALYHSGVLGAGVEIKRPDTDAFVVISILDFIPEPACFFNLSFSDLDLTQGTNTIKIVHLGGPFLRDNKIRLSLNSEAIYFNVTVDAEGNITVEKIEQ